jgi:hypothetical protein
MAGNTREFDRKKFKELIVYLCQAGANDELLGAVKLNKLLFYADKIAYLRRGRSITGARYVHMREGPVPIALVPIREDLLAEGRLQWDPRPAGTMTPKRLQARGPVDQRPFDGDELAIADEVIRRFWYLDGSALTRLSHFEAGWLLTDDQKDIPENTFWLSAAPLDDEQVALGQALWQQRSA